MSKRIRWEPTEYGFTGRVGTLEPWLFRAWRPTEYNAEWELTATLPGMLDESWTAVGGATPDELKAEAERWLEEFVSSLGAVFPAETQTPPEMRACRHCDGDIVPCPPPHRAMIPACKGWKHVQFADSMPIGAHYCEGRSVRPSAEPAPHPEEEE